MSLILFEILSYKFDEKIECKPDGHVSIVNSNVVHDVGIDRITSFLLKYSDDFYVQFSNILFTVSKDFSEFSDCYVIEINSDHVKIFNKEFGTNVNPFLHVTFASRMRSLLNKHFFTVGN